MALNVKIATDIFRQKWFRELSTNHKALWFFLMAESTIVGVFEIDAAMWNFACAPTKPYEANDAFTVFGNRVQRLPKHPDKGIVVGKLDYQKTFGIHSKQWEWVLKALSDVGLTYEKLQEMKAREDEQLELPLAHSAPAPAPVKPVKRDERKTIPPQVEWVERYCAERQNGVDAKKFFDFYESKGWKVGSNPMKDWQAAIRTWEKSTTAAPATEAVGQVIRKVF